MFYRAIVRDNKDPDKLGRVKVKIDGLHDTNVLDEHLPWAEVAGGTEFGLLNGVGLSSVLLINTMVWVFLNYNDSNYPVVFATVKGIADVNNDAKGEYTNMQMIKTPSGHTIKLNDTPGNEIIQIKHRTGSKVTIDKDGTIFIESIKDMNHNVVGNYNIDVTGNYKVTAARIDLN